MADAFYTELHEALRDLCDPASGEFSSGDRFLTERQVAERFGTTRPTANKALASLVGQGVLEFRRGVGTFVREGPPVVDLRPVASLNEMGASVGCAVTNKVIAFRKTRGSRVDEVTRSALKIDTREPLLAIDRLRYVDDNPFALERMVVVAKHCDDLNRNDAKGSLVTVWEDYYKLEIEAIDQVVSASVANAELAADLGVKRGAPLLCVTHTGVLKGGDRLWHGESLFRGDSYELVGRLGGPSVARPVVGRILVDADPYDDDDADEDE